MSRVFLDALGETGGVTVPAGTYTVEVVDARQNEEKPFIWLDLKIVGGPDDQRVVSTGLNVPDDGSSRGAIFHFGRKARGFATVFAEKKISKLSDEEQVSSMAEAVIGLTVEAVLSIQQGGQYDGTQQLEETREIVNVAPPVRTVPETTTETSVDVGTQTTINATVNEPLDPPF